MTDSSFAQLKWVALSCPHSARANCVSFYTCLGMCKRDAWWPRPRTGVSAHSSDSSPPANLQIKGVTAMEAAGYANGKDACFLALVDTPPFATTGSNASAGIDGPDKLVFYCKDITATLEHLEHVECGHSLMQSPIDCGHHCIIACVKDPVGTTVALVQLGNERQYVSDRIGISAKEHRARQSSIMSTSWEVRLAYVQIVTSYPEEVSRFLEGIFAFESVSGGGVSGEEAGDRGSKDFTKEASKSDADSAGNTSAGRKQAADANGSRQDSGTIQGLRLLDKEDVQDTSFAFVGSEPRESRPALCFKHTATSSGSLLSGEGGAGGGGGGRASAGGDPPGNKPGASKSEPALVRILPGRIIGIGLTTTSLQMLQLRIKERSRTLSSLLHLGRPLRLIGMHRNRDVYGTLQNMFPEATLFELCEAGKMAKPKLAISLIGLETDEDGQ